MNIPYDRQFKLVAAQELRQGDRITVGSELVTIVHPPVHSPTGLIVANAVGAAGNPIPINMTSYPPMYGVNVYESTEPGQKIS